MANRLLGFTQKATHQLRAICIRITRRGGAAGGRGRWGAGPRLGCPRRSEGASDGFPSWLGFLFSFFLFFSFPFPVTDRFLLKL